MKYIRSGSFKRLFSIRSRSLGEENDEGQPKGVSDKHGTEEKIWAFTEVETEHSRRPSWKCYSFEEIFIATNGFSPDNLVGKGGCIEVFKGILSDGRTVAVKNLTKATTEERREREFLAEIGTIGHVSHPKVSSLLGYCIENGLFLIFCFSTMGSVASCLHGRKIKTEVGFRMEYLRTGSFKWLLPPISCGGFQVEENQGGDGERRQRFFDQYRTKEARGGLREVETEEIKRPSWKCFSYEEIFLATNGFSSDYLVGKGGSSEVYKGIQSDGQILAVKKLKRTSRGGRSEREFLTEIGTIGHVSHPNVSSLLGYCIENGLFLIFRFYPRGSVASCLHDGNSPPLEWKIRYKIAVGTARGLHYLHRGCKRRIIHRDIKASNILLSEDYEPQISDFGLAKWLPTQWTHHSIGPIEGTVGYLAPEYFSHGIVDEKTDVFAFGVFLLQLISGKKPVDASHRSLRAWAKPYLKQGEIQKLIDPRLDGAYDQTQLKQLAFAASLCVRASSTRRPTIAQVLEIMETGNIDIERWAMPEKEEKQEDVWASEDLECDCDSSFSSSTGRK